MTAVAYIRAAVYIRVSDDMQIEGTSLDFQDEVCRNYCEQRGMEVTAIFRDEGKTAKDLSLNNRTQFLAALEFCRRAKPPIDAFVVYKVDRFARNADDHFAVRRILRSYGTTLHSVSEPIGDSPVEKFVETVLAGAAEFDNAVRKQRCTDGMKSRINQGIWPFKPPIGYACAHHRLKGEKKTKPDEPDGDLFLLIQKALWTYASGDIASQAALTSQLNLWGFERLAGRRATNQLVDRLLGKYLVFYAGLLRNPWTGEERDGLHQPMISLDDMHRIHLRRFGAGSRKSASRTHFNSDFPLRRLLRCSECGRFLTACRSTGNGGGYGYYYCLNRLCSRRSKSIPSSVLHPAFAALLRQLKVSPKAWSNVEAKLRTYWSLSRGVSASAVQAHADKLRDLRERRKRICEMREDGTYDAPTSQARLRDIDAEIASLVPPPPVNSLTDIDIEKVVVAARWFLERPHEIWRQITAASRARFERVAFPSGFSYTEKDGVRTTIPGLIFAISAPITLHQSLEVDLAGFNSNQLHDYFSELIAFHRTFLGTSHISRSKAA